MSRFGLRQISLSANTDYVFSAWLASVYPAVGNPPIAPATIIISTSMETKSIILRYRHLSGHGSCSMWRQGPADGAFANLSLIDKNLTASGNDFALDDISLVLRTRTYHHAPSWSWDARNGGCKEIQKVVPLILERTEGRVDWLCLFVVRILMINNRNMYLSRKFKNNSTGSYT